MSKVRPLTILLAEDNIDHAELIVETLKEFNIGNDIHHVTNGELVLDFLQGKPPFDQQQHNRPDLILLDLKMPRLDGKGTLKGIRELPNYQKTPVVMVSTSSTDEDIDECYDLGANSYITKPLQFEEFTRKIRELNLYWVLTAELPSAKASAKL